MGQKTQYKFHFHPKVSNIKNNLTDHYITFKYNKTNYKVNYNGKYDWSIKPFSFY